MVCTPLQSGAPTSSGAVKKEPKAGQAGGILEMSFVEATPLLKDRSVAMISLKAKGLKHVCMCFCLQIGLAFSRVILH